MTALWIAEPTGTCRLVLRRFRLTTDPDGHMHDASVVIEDDTPVSGTQVPDDDPRWPAACSAPPPPTSSCRSSRTAF